MWKDFTFKAVLILLIGPEVVTRVFGKSQYNSIVEQLNQARTSYNSNTATETLSETYAKIIPSFYNKSAMLDYAFNPSYIGGGNDYCPNLCLYCPPGSDTCCKLDLATTGHCKQCDESGNCIVCDRGYSINAAIQCESNKHCTHTNSAGVCDRCNGGYTMPRRDFMCAYNPKCKHESAGACKKCKHGYTLDDNALCVKTTSSPSLTA